MLLLPESNSFPCVADEKVREPTTGYMLDFMIEPVATGVGGGCALEVNGAPHFVGRAGAPRRRENGVTRLKRRLLARVGRRVASVPWWEWSEAGRSGGAEAQRALLLRAIEQALAAPAPTPLLLPPATAATASSAPASHSQ